MKYTSDNKVGVEREKTLKLNYDLRLQLEKLNQMVQEQKKRYTIIWFNFKLREKDFSLYSKRRGDPRNVDRDRRIQIYMAYIYIYFNPVFLFL